MATFHRHSGETRYERLDRIKRELQELEKSDDGDGIDGEMMMMGLSVQDLQGRLEGLMGSNILTRQRDLTKVVALSGSASTSATTSVSTTATTNNASEMSQEERLLKIERMLGSDTNSTSIMERLKTAEQNLSNINEKTLSQASSRAKVIRADLEAAAKARSKINSNTQDAIKVSKLYTQMTELDGFLSSDSHVLNAIVGRLGACAELHSRSMDFGRGMDELEAAVVDVKALLASMEDAVGSLESGMESNMKIIQENMESLDQRLASKE